MNAYKFEVKAPASFIKQWLVKNGCPKAAKSVSDILGQAHFTIEGNVSAVSVINAFDDCSISFKAVPVGNSEPLPRIYVVGV